MAVLAELTDTISVAADAISTNFGLQQLATAGTLIACSAAVGARAARGVAALSADRRPITCARRAPRYCCT